MSFIYSRPRIRLPRILITGHHNNMQRTHKKKIKFLLLLLIFLVGFSFILNGVMTMFNSMCLDKARSIATMITNQETTNVIQQYEYSDFMMIHKDEKGNILMLESNMKNINNVTANIANQIQLSIDNTQNENIGIYLGSFTGISFLAGRGIQIPIRVITAGNVKTTEKSELINQGINQTLHRLYLEIECEISILTPLNTLKETIINQLIIADNVIVGNIPNSYYNIEGVTGNQALELVK